MCVFVSFWEATGDYWDQSLSAGVVNVRYVEMHGKEGSMLIFFRLIFFFFRFCVCLFSEKDLWLTLLEYSVLDMNAIFPQL